MPVEFICLMLLSSLKSFGFNTTVSWENTKVLGACLCIFIYASVVTSYSSENLFFRYKQIRVHNTELFSLFFINEKKLYTYIIYVIECCDVLLPTYIYHFFSRRISSSFTDSHRRACIFQIVFMLYII